MRYVFHALLLLATHVAVAAPVEFQLVQIDGKPMAGTVVTLRSTDLSRAVLRPTPAKIDQKDLQFVPHVLVVPTGSAISFPNSDSVLHQVYSFSPTKRFELKLYKGKPADAEVFDKAGVVTLGCNIHDAMRAYVYVVDAQHFGRADAQGRWSLPEVEPGDYTVTVWHPLSRQQKPVLEQRISIAQGGAKLTLRATAALKLRADAQVPANWDAY